MIQAASQVVAVLEGLHDHHRLADLRQGCQGRRASGVSSCGRPSKSDLKVRSQVQPSRLGSHLDHGLELHSQALPFESRPKVRQDRRQVLEVGLLSVQEVAIEGGREVVRNPSHVLHEGVHVRVHGILYKVQGVHDQAAALVPSEYPMT